MSYTKTTFVDDSAPYLSASELNKIGTGIEDAHDAVESLANKPCAYATGSTASNINLTTEFASVPTSDQIPISFVFIPTATNNAGATVTPSWGATAYPIYDKSTNAQIAAGVIKANQPVELYFDGVKFWVDGDSRYLQRALVGSNVNGYFDNGTADPTGTTRLNYSGKFYATELHANEVWGSVYNETAADIAEGYHVSDTCLAGDLIAINADGTLSVNKMARNKKIVGFVSNEYGVLLGTVYGDTPICCSGKLHVNCVGNINPGDFLVASHECGRVEAATDVPERMTVVGMALEPSKNGKVLMLWQRM